MIEGTIFIGAVVIALTQAIKLKFPNVDGAVTILIAAIIGGLIALVDQWIGVADLSVAAGIMAGLAAAGTVTVAKSISATDRV